LEFVPVFNELQEQFCGRAAFACVYLSEAHARNQWPVGSSVSEDDAPTTLQDRMKLARKMIKKTGLRIPIVVDDMDDSFGLTYSAWPLRYYVLGANGDLLYIAQPDPVSRLFEVEDLKCWMEEYFA